MGDVRSIARVVLVVTLLCKSVLATMLAVRFQASHGLSWPDVIWTGVFHAIAAFNNAGFSLHGDSLMRYAGDALGADAHHAGHRHRRHRLPGYARPSQQVSRPTALVLAYQLWCEKNLESRSSASSAPMKTSSKPGLIYTSCPAIC